MPVRITDLPADVRKRLQSRAEKVAPKTGVSGSPRLVEDPETGSNPTKGGPAYRCHTCGQEWPRWGAAVERHTAETGHSRFDMAL